MSRPLCSTCNKRFAAVNRHVKGKIYYRKQCDSCLRRNRQQKPPTPKWAESGYTQKVVCDRCRFRAKSLKQTIVYHLDGNLNNCNLNNLRTVCLNCSIEVVDLQLPWQVSGL